MTNPTISTADAGIDLVDNAVIIANVIELASGIVANIDASTANGTMNRDGMSRAVLANLVANDIKASLTAQ